MAEVKCPSCHLMPGSKAKSYNVSGDVTVSYLPRIVFARSLSTVQLLFLSIL